MATAKLIQANSRTSMKETLRIQDCFVPEPVLAKTGLGHLKSRGVTTLLKLRAGFRRRNDWRSELNQALRNLE